MTQLSTDSHSLPEAWQVEQQPDGSVRFIPAINSSGGCGFYFAAPFVLLLPVGLHDYLAGVQFISWGERGAQPRIYQMGFIAAVAVAFLSRQIWLSFGKEEWRASSNLLEVRRSLFGHSRTKRWADAALKIRHHVGDVSQQEMTGVHSSDLVVEASRHRYTIVRLSGQSSPTEIHGLGVMLSQVTGWPLQLPIEGADGRSQRKH